MNNYIEWKGKWKNNLLNPLALSAYNLAKNIEERFKKYGGELKIIKHGYNPLFGDGYKFKVNIEKSGSIKKMEKHINDVRLAPNLHYLQILRGKEALYITTHSPQSILKSLDYNLSQISRTPEFRAAYQSMKIIHPVGVTKSNRIVIKDLTDYPHVMINGTSQSGKSTALKSLIANLLLYPPKKVNLLLADGGYMLSLFKDLPHLSHPIINDYKTLAYVLSLLEEEMTRRIDWIREDLSRQSTLPYIVCIIDEFPIFMGNIISDKKFSAVKQTIENILRLGRNANIHMVLSIHDTKKENRKIEIPDIPVKLQFEIINARSSSNNLGLEVSDTLQLRGEMIYTYHGEKHHLHGVLVEDDDIEKYIYNILERHTPEELSKGGLGYTISNEDIEKKKSEIIKPFLTVPSNQNTEIYQEEELKDLPKVIMWTLSQNRVSANAIKNSNTCGKNPNTARSYYLKLQELGIAGGDKDRYDRLEVLPKLIDELSEAIKDYLYNSGLSENDIEQAFSIRKIK